MRTSVAAFLFLLLLPVPGRAQVDRATLTGVVRDPADAVVPAAVLTTGGTGS